MIEYGHTRKVVSMPLMRLRESPTMLTLPVLTRTPQSHMYSHRDSFRDGSKLNYPIALHILNSTGMNGLPVWLATFALLSLCLTGLRQADRQPIDSGITN